MILFITLSVLCILLLTVKQKRYWQDSQLIRLGVTKDVVIVLLCVGFSYASIQLHQAKEARHIPFEVGKMDHVAIQKINFIDRAMAGQWDMVAKDRGKTIKNVATYLIPLSLLFFAGSIKRRLVLFFVFTQGYVLTESLTGIAKGLVDRFRPFAYMSKESIENLDSEAKSEVIEDLANYDIQNSFFSGDASISAFGLVFFAISFGLFYPQSRFTKIIWVLAISGTILACYFRVQSGKHFPTDTLIGALVGSLITFGIIRIHRV